MSKQMTTLHDLQDAELDGISSALGRLHNIASNIDSELEVQDKLTTEISNDMDYTDNRFTRLNKKITKLINESGGCKAFGCIVCLFVVAVVLFAVLIF